MSKLTAKNNYIGLGEKGRMNCAQSVISAFQEKFDIEDKEVAAFSAFGGGRAPAGMCGALYATKTIVQKYGVEKSAELDKFFLDNAGAIDCGSIKAHKKLSCVGCVEKCSEFLEKLD